MSHHNERHLTGEPPARPAALTLPGSEEQQPHHRARIAFWRIGQAAEYRYFATHAEAYRSRFVFRRIGQAVSVQHLAADGRWIG